MFCPCHQETFWSLLHDSAHWKFELFLMLIFDVAIGMLLWPFAKNLFEHYKHHLARDNREGTTYPVEKV